MNSLSVNLCVIKYNRVIFYFEFKTKLFELILHQRLDFNI